ncbi:MAG: site-specific tyrosine recombinase XerD [Dehalococcoidia bacterium]
MDEQVQQFLGFMSIEKGAAANTISAYRNDLEQFRQFVHLAPSNGQSRTWGEVNPELLQDYIGQLRKKEYADATVARKVAAVKSFFNYLTAEGVVASDPTETLSSPRVGKTLPKALSVREVDELLEQPRKRSTPEAKRDKAMLELLYATGMRVSELVALNLDSIELHNNRATVRCLGKGGKERLIPIHEQAVHALRVYLQDARPELARSRREKALFINRRGERLTRQGFWLILKNYAKAANIPNDVTPHTLRHSFATHMLRGGAPLRSVQELLGHANISTTQVYTQLTDAHVRRVYDNAHPRAR